MPAARAGVVTFAGRPLTLVGEPVQVGWKAQDFVAVDGDLQEWRFSERTAGAGARLISVVPSLDTPVCSLQTRRFDQEQARLPKSVQVVTVSMDLPFAQARWRQEAGVERVQLISDHRYAAFGLAYGALIKELRLLTRAVFVVDARGVITHAQYVSELTQEPDYDAALAALRALRAAG